MKKKALLIILFLVMMGIPTLATSTDRPTAKFVLASWDYPDEYGQGIEQIQVEENSTGSWEPVDLRKYYEGQHYEWNVSLFSRLRLWVWMNNTIVDAADLADGWNYQRLNVTVTQTNGTIVFDRQNFTEFVAYDTYDPMWLYQYYVILDFLPDYGQIYTATVDYEIYYDLGDKTILTATSGSVEASSTTGDYTDTHDLDGVLFGGFEDTAITVILWVTFSGTIDGFDFAAYWNASGIASIHIYNHTLSDWTLYDNSPNGDDSPLTWDNGTIENEDFYNSTHIGFRFYTYTYAHLYVDYFQIQRSYQGGWHDVAEAELYFVVPFDMWGFDTALIIAGLIMIPASALFLVWGGKNKMSSDKLFYALLVFMLGFGLLVAGVMP